MDKSIEEGIGRHRGKGTKGKRAWHGPLATEAEQTRKLVSVLLPLVDTCAFSRRSKSMPDFLVLIFFYIFASHDSGHASTDLSCFLLQCEGPKAHTATQYSSHTQNNREHGNITVKRGEIISSPPPVRPSSAETGDTTRAYKDSFTHSTPPLPSPLASSSPTPRSMRASSRAITAVPASYTLKPSPFLSLNWALSSSYPYPHHPIRHKG